MDRLIAAIAGSPVRSLLLTGGIPLGEYTPQVSDIDIIAVLEGKPEERGPDLLRWVSGFSDTALEILFIERAELEKEAPAGVRSFEPLEMYRLHAFDSILLRKHSVVLCGEDCRSAVRELHEKQEIAGILYHVLNRMASQILLDFSAHRPRTSGNEPVIAVGNALARCLYTLFHYELVSKPEALRWGIARFGDEPGCGPLADLFRWLLAWRSIDKRPALNLEEPVLLFRQSIPIYRALIRSRLEERPLPSGEALLEMLHNENTGSSADIPVFSSCIF